MSIIKNGQLIAGITPIDSTSVTYNTNGALQSVGNINKNTATGADAVKYDWVGTLSQYTTQDIENTHPEWTCYITDDQGGIGPIYNAAQSDLRYFKKDVDDKIIISGLGMPSDRYESVTLLASGNSYTATANGLFSFKMKCGSSSSTKTVTISSVSGKYVEYLVITNNMQSKNQYMTHWVKSGDSITISWDTNAITTADCELTFIYAEGNQTSNS